MFATGPWLNIKFFVGSSGPTFLKSSLKTWHVQNLMKNLKCCPSNKFLGNLEPDIFVFLQFTNDDQSRKTKRLILHIVIDLLWLNG